MIKCNVIFFLFLIADIQYISIDFDFELKAE